MPQNVTTNNDNRRGICNTSKVSCHIACAIQILCHAIPPVRTALNRLAADEEVSEYGSILKSKQSSPDVLLEELLDFIRPPKPYKKDIENISQDGSCNDREKSSFHPEPWDPQRLYRYLQRSPNGIVAIDQHNVGDATRSLSCLLRLLSQEVDCGGPAWKALLDASVWEGETMQILYGRRPLLEENAEITHIATNSCQGEESKIRRSERRFLQRIKPAAKNKPMSSPLILKFSPCTTSKWSVQEALNELMKPQRIYGSSYPWDSISPDTYSEKEIVCSCSQEKDGNDSHSNSGGTDINSESDCDSKISSNKSNGDSDSDDNSDSGSTSSIDDTSNDDMDWITSKRLEIKRIPRVWLLHLDRPRISPEKLQRSLAKLKPNEKDNGTCFSLFDHIDVPLQLDELPIMTAGTALKNDSGEGADDSTNRSHNYRSGSKTDGSSSFATLFLQGAIVQVIELDVFNEDITESEEDWEGGHSITLLRNTGAVEEPLSWLLIDDENIQSISEERAIRMIGGVFEGNEFAQNNNKSTTVGDWRYFAASLLVYSIPEAVSEVNGNGCWESFQDDVVSSWKEHRTQLAATISLQEAFVGKRIRVKWAKEKYYQGTVTNFDRETGKHRVTYDDGDVREYDLAKKTIEWIE